MKTTAKPHSEERSRPWRRRLRIILPAGCLFLLGGALFLNVLSVRLFHGPDPSPTGIRLSWDRDLGRGRATSDPLGVTEISPPQSESVLSQVLSVDDAVEGAEGWILLDGMAGKIHFFQPTSSVLRSVGGEGAGPGELKNPVLLALGDSLIWVVNQRGLTLDRFSEEGEFLDRTKLQGGGCLVGLAKGLVVIPGAGAFLMRVCPGTLPGPGTTWVERVEPDGTLTPILSLTLGENGSRRLHLLRQPAVAPAEGGLFLGTWDTPCVGEFDLGGRRRGLRCLPAYQRPRVPAGDRPRLERRLGRIAELGFLPVEIPDHLPWYDRIFSTPRGLVARRIRGEEDRDLVLLQSDGQNLVTDSFFPENTFVGGETILTVRDLPQGTKLAVFPNPWPGKPPDAPTEGRIP